MKWYILEQMRIMILKVKISRIKLIRGNWCVTERMELVWSLGSSLVSVGSNNGVERGYPEHVVEKLTIPYMSIAHDRAHRPHRSCVSLRICTMVCAEGRTTMLLQCTTVCVPVCCETSFLWLVKVSKVYD